VGGGDEVEFFLVGVFELVAEAAVAGVVAEVGAAEVSADAAGIVVSEGLESSGIENRSAVQGTPRRAFRTARFWNGIWFGRARNATEGVPYSAGGGYVRYSAGGEGVAHGTIPTKGQQFLRIPSHASRALNFGVQYFRACIR